jgi:hypothetical protein
MRLMWLSRLTPVQPGGHLLDVSRFTSAMIALDHHPAVEREPGQDCEGRLAIELVRIIDIGHMFRANRETRHLHVDVDAEDFARIYAGIGHVDGRRGGGTSVGEGSDVVHKPRLSCLCPGGARLAA